MQQAIRSRAATTLAGRFYRRPFSSNAQTATPSPPAPSAAAAIDNAESTQTPTPPPPPGTETTKRIPPLLKFGLVGAVTGAVATAGYATYAYTADELDEKTKAFRSSVNRSPGDAASGLEKFQSLLYTAAMAVPAKAVDFYLELRRSIEDQVKEFAEPTSDKLLPDLHPLEQHVFTLVLDLKETLVYSDWTRERGWRTLKRPGVDEFLQTLGQFYEIVVYSDEQSMYVDPVMEKLDTNGFVRYRLSRAATKYQNGKHYRDLSKLNRDPSRILYISGHALETSLQPENCVSIKPWKSEADDTTLIDLIPFLQYVARFNPPDIRPVLASYEGKDIPTEFLERTKEHQRRMQEQKNHGPFWRR